MERKKSHSITVDCWHPESRIQGTVLRGRIWDHLDSILVVTLAQQHKQASSHAASACGGIRAFPAPCDQPIKGVSEVKQRKQCKVPKETAVQGQPSTSLPEGAVASRKGNLGKHHKDKHIEERWTSMTLSAGDKSKSHIQRSKSAHTQQKF